MNYPRLVIADERKRGLIPPSILITLGLKQLGYSVRLFAGGVDECFVRLLELICDESVTVLDPWLARSDANLRRLFCSTADSGAVNIILAPLGVKRNEISFDIDEETVKLAKSLDAGIITLTYADPLAAVNARLVESIYEKVVLQEGLEFYGSLFASVLNPKEYQLLEMEVGRRFPLLCLGYVPQNMERPCPSLEDLCLDERIAVPARAMVAKLRGMRGQIDWAAIVVFSRYCPICDWNVQEVRPLPGGSSVAVLSDRALRLGGSNALNFFRSLGCRIIEVDIERDSLPSRSSLIYIPHGLGYLCFGRLSENTVLRDQLCLLKSRRRRMLVNGGFTPLLGRSFQCASKGTREGLSLLPMNFNFERCSWKCDRVEVNAASDGALFQSGERARGYYPDYMVQPLCPPDESRWTIREEKLRNIGETGWSVGGIVATHVPVELWGCENQFRRWLSSER